MSKVYQDAARWVQLTDEQILAAIASKLCPACGGAKNTGALVSKDCWLALPVYLRSWLSTSRRDHLFFEAVRRALRHLHDLGPRRASIETATGGRIAWPYSTFADLERAGWVYSRDGRCRGPRCCARIVWYVTPDRKRYFAVDYEVEVARPHSLTCRDPEGVARLQSPAKKKRGRKRA